MCRLAAWSKIRPSAADLEYLQMSLGGDGDGWIVPRDAGTVQAAGVSAKIVQDAGDVQIFRFMPPAPRKRKKKKPAYANYAYLYLYESCQPLHYTHIPAAAFYHTRLRSSGHYGLHATHPAAVGDWLVMQNGTEPHLDVDGRGDYVGVACMLDKGLIQPEALQYITTSNWFIVNLRSLEFTIIVTNTMYFVKEGNDEWLLTSEPLYPSRPIKGILRGIIKPDYLVLTHEDIEEVAAYEERWPDLYR
jgi:hypothetical protein